MNTSIRTRQSPTNPITEVSGRPMGHAPMGIEIEESHPAFPDLHLLG